MKNAKEKEKKTDKDRSLLNDLCGLLLRIAWIGMILLAAFCFVLGAAVNHGTGMHPALHDGDLVIFYRLGKEYAAGDVVVYDAAPDVRLIGRIAAKGGDTVEATEAGFKINGYLREERYASGDLLLPEQGAEYPMKLAEDEYFILFDVRTEVGDSRVYGAVTKKQILGRLMLLLRRRNF